MQRFYGLLLGCRAWGLRFRLILQALRFRVKGLGFMVWAVGFIFSLSLSWIHTQIRVLRSGFGLQFPESGYGVSSSGLEVELMGQMWAKSFHLGLRVQVLGFGAWG